VDGQHRLLGALKQADATLLVDPFKEEMLTRIAAGDDEKQVQRDLRLKACRRLPVSLLWNPDPAEHVFQFVIVNQKATPIGRALLGTIVATTLSNDELSRVSERLTGSGIMLEEARHVAFLSRNPDSPFHNTIEKGLSSDEGGLLPFTVMVSLVKIFRDLRGGKLWGESNDYADIWRRELLGNSGVVADWEGKGFENPYVFWRSDEGPWRPIFVEFWRAVREKLGNDDHDAHNTWGHTRNSNLFNKIYLHILAADFFQFLTERELTIVEVSEVKILVVEEWLKDAKPSYFDRDWHLTGQKKDVPGIRKQWANLWVTYRKSKGGKAPAASLFKTAAS
jgi:hypothetical protein